MTGVQLAEAARALRPGLPVLFMSGFADLAGIVGGERIETLVRKPFRQADLIGQVARGLQDRRVGPA
jgi:FixJ family two-component response regulator